MDNRRPEQYAAYMLIYSRNYLVKWLLRFPDDGRDYGEGPAIIPGHNLMHVRHKVHCDGERATHFSDPQHDRHDITTSHPSPWSRRSIWNAEGNLLENFHRTIRKKDVASTNCNTVAASLIQSTNDYAATMSLRLAFAGRSMRMASENYQCSRECRPWRSFDIRPCSVHTSRPGSDSLVIRGVGTCKFSVEHDRLNQLLMTIYANEEAEVPAVFDVPGCQSWWPNLHKIWNIH